MKRKKQAPFKFRETPKSQPEIAPESSPPDGGWPAVRDKEEGRGAQDEDDDGQLHDGAVGADGAKGGNHLGAVSLDGDEGRQI